MPTANHVLLQRTTLSVDAATVTLSGIPTTGYTDLKLVMSARTTYAGAQSDYVIVKFNNTTTTYTGKLLIGTGTSVSSISPSGWRWFAEVNSNGQTAKTFGNAEVYIPNYSVVGIQKSYSSDSVSESNAATTEMEMFAGLWSGTDAINTIEMASGNAGNFMEGSSFSLYGIANAVTTPVTAPKADGGDIIKTDGTYWYHAFLSSGLFRPQLNLTCDVLMVSGGGGGSNQGGIGAGGGAGAVHYSTSNAFTTSPITITVGAGGTQDLTSSGPGQAGSLSAFNSTTISVSNGALGGPGTGGVGGASKSVISGTTTNYTGGATSGAEPNRAGGGGAGAGANGGAASSGSYGGAGGAGLSTYSSWATATGTGVSGYYAGGGGGGFEYNGAASRSSGGAGGGGAGGAGTSAPNYNALNGTANTGGGGGGAGGRSGVVGGLSGAGGSGIVIIRYPV